ncbi:MAG: thioesterase [Defluviitaleaceae bacterium]|nr:thioesterase [Defluviitaleaceae bacterium]MCL2262206.1 thioesterase [Defluviitaleaceae bacterium]
MYTGKHKITYYDLDLAGRVKLSALLRMVHIAADINANDLKIGFKELSAINMTFVLQRIAFGAARIPAYGETVEIRTWPSSVARGTFIRKGDMYDESGKKIMEWASLWILFNISERKILKPSALPLALPECEDHGVKIMPEKIILPTKENPFGAEFSAHTHTVRYADVDTNQHMNNSIYGDLIGNAIGSQNWREVQINYLAETRQCEEISITAYHSTDTFLITGAASNRTSFAARVVV